MHDCIECGGECECPCINGDGCDGCETCIECQAEQDDDYDRLEGAI